MDLINAARNGDIIKVRKLLDSGINPNIRDKWDHTPLIAASREGHTNVARLLLERGVDPNIRNRYDGNTPLMSASLKGHTEIVKLLLEYGADPNIQDRFGNTSLAEAYRQGLIDKSGNPSVLKALREEYSNIVELLLKNGADPTIKNEYGSSPYNSALGARHKEIARLIIEHMDLQRVQRPLQNLAFMKYFLDRDDLDIDTASKIFSNVYSYNPDVGRRIRDEQRRNMILEEENNRIADYLNTIEQYGSGKRSKGKHGKKRSKKHSKKRSKKHSKKT